MESTTDQWTSNEKASRSVPWNPHCDYYYAHVIEAFDKPSIVLTDGVVLDSNCLEREVRLMGYKDTKERDSFNVEDSFHQRHSWNETSN